METKPWVIPATVGVASFAIGGVVGYIAAKTRNTKSGIGKLESKLDDIKSEIEELHSENVQLEFKFDEGERRINSVLQQTSHVAKQFKDNSKELLTNIGSSYDVAAHEETHEEKPEDRHPSNISNEKRGITLAPIYNKDDDSLVVNIFQEEDDDWDYDEEDQNRGPNEPYVIHRDEYFSNEKDYRQCSLMYYSGDNILCDEHDVPLYNPEKVVGKLMFGHGSRDPSIVYIRNEYLESEFEVLFDPGSFQTEVLGQTPDNLRHSYGVPKFRME